MSANHEQEITVLYQNAKTTSDGPRFLPSLHKAIDILPLSVHSWSVPLTEQRGLHYAVSGIQLLVPCKSHLRGNGRRARGSHCLRLDWMRGDAIQLDTIFATEQLPKAPSISL